MRVPVFAVKLQQAQDAIARLPWVESAQVRKRWPDVLEVHVTEHKPFARWGTDRMLSEQGRLFRTPPLLKDFKLPQLGGPDSKTQDVVALYNESRALFAPTGLDVERLEMDARGSWSLGLSNGVQIVVGRDDARARLQRFARMLPQLADPQRPISRADLRYTNGFTVERRAVESGDSGLENRRLGIARHPLGLPWSIRVSRLPTPDSRLPALRHESQRRQIPHRWTGHRHQGRCAGRRILARQSDR